MGCPFVMDRDEEATLVHRVIYLEVILRHYLHVLSFPDDNILYCFSSLSIIYLHNLICPHHSNVYYMLLGLNKLTV